MPSQWFAPHTAGFSPLVLRLAARDLPGSSPRADGDNAIRLASGSEPRSLLAFCRSLFRVIAEAPGGLEKASRAFASSARIDARAGGRSFVLRSFGPDDPASIPLEARRELEALISRATGMRPDSEHPEREYRLQERADGRTLFLERSAQASEPPPRSGELPRTTCRLLAEMTDPRPDDVFLDPFCGYGGIVLERALASPYRFAFASDTDGAKVAAVKEALSAKAFAKRRKTFFPKLRDALDAAAYKSGFVSAIATDPPWGLFEGGMGASEAEALVASFLAEASRLLPSGGRLVLLVARSLDAAAAAEALHTAQGPAFLLRESLDVLVSGKKARALRLDRA